VRDTGTPVLQVEVDGPPGPGADTPAAPLPLLRLESLTKRFGTLTACNAVSLDIRAGEVLALLGENGAGKSTLMKTLFGIHPADGGRILIDGAPVSFASPREAMQARIGMVFQTLSLIDAISVRDNLALAWPGLPWHLGRRAQHARGSLAHLADLAPDIDPAARIEDLSVGERQLVELAKVLNLDARLVILDEPTAGLTPAEARRLHGLIGRLAGRGVAVVLITHKLADVEAAADRVAVLRRGSVVLEGRAADLDRPALIGAMMGQAPANAIRPPSLTGHLVPRLVLRDVSASGPQGCIDRIDLAVRGGEILGIAGVAGNGQSVLAEAVAGILPVSRGDILLDGESIARKPGDPFRPLRIGYVPEDPRRNGVAPGLSLRANLALRDLVPDADGPAGAARAAADDAAVQQRLRDFEVRPPEPRRKAETLSGGNLQKLILARETGEARPAIVMVFPTLGLDIAAARAVFRRMAEAAAEGSAILWISEEIDDLLALAHSISVLRAGRVAASFRNDGTITRDRLGEAMTGGQA
jgi:simple sugar transport system ATP-binding protein